MVWGFFLLCRFVCFWTLKIIFVILLPILFSDLMSLLCILFRDRFPFIYYSAWFLVPGILMFKYFLVLKGILRFQVLLRLSVATEFLLWWPSDPSIPHLWVNFPLFTIWFNYFLTRFVVLCLLCHVFSFTFCHFPWLCSAVSCYPPVSHSHD